VTQKEYQRLWMQQDRKKHPEKYRAYARKYAAQKREYSRERYHERMNLLRALKLQKGCVDCGYNANAAALDFDHVKGRKKFTIMTGNNASRSWSVLLREIKKCVVRCANCHRIMTATRRQL